MNTFSQFVLSCLSMAVLVKCYPLQNFGHLLEENSYGGSSGGYESSSGGYGGSSGGYGGSSGGYGGGEEYQHEHKHEPGMPYKFGYKVYDPKHGTNFGQNEHSDGDVVKGSYEVLLPDGRLQQVTYTADWKTGYHADVQYHGEAIKEPEHSYGGGGSYEGGAEHAGYSPSVSSEHAYSGY